MQFTPHESNNEYHAERDVIDASVYGPEHVNMVLPSGEMARFNRIWSGYRFTDREVAALVAGMEIRIRTAYTDGIIGSLDWQEYGGYEYLGFAPWDAESYDRTNAPFPLQWNGYTFTAEEQAVLRAGERLLIVCTSNHTGRLYPVNVTFELRQEVGYPTRWAIVPDFEEFNQVACDIPRTHCSFMPIFGGKRLTIADITVLRQGGTIPFEGISRHGRMYTCVLSLELDKARNKWRLVPYFN